AERPCARALPARPLRAGVRERDAAALPRLLAALRAGAGAAPPPAGRRQAQGEARAPCEAQAPGGKNAHTPAQAAVRRALPALGHGPVYRTSNKGVVWGVSPRTGKAAWKCVSGRCAAASPALAYGIVFQTFLNRPPCNSARSSGLDGELVAFNVGFGKVRWRV